MIMAGIAYCVMVMGSLTLVGTNGSVSPNWLISTYLLLTFAELLLSPVYIRDFGRDYRDYKVGDYSDTCGQHSGAYCTRFCCGALEHAEQSVDSDPYSSQSAKPNCCCRPWAYRLSAKSHRRNSKAP